MKLINFANGIMYYALLQAIKTVLLTIGSLDKIQFVFAFKYILNYPSNGI